MRAVVLRGALAVVWVVGVWFVTLGLPGSGVAPEGFLTCLFCGSRGTSNILLNIVLFLPLGVLVGLRWRPWVALLAGLVISGAIETLQLGYPGRSSAVGDMVANSAGAGIGAFIPRWFRRWLPGETWEGRITSLVLPALYLLLAGLSQVKVGSDVQRLGQGADLDAYGGEVLSVFLNGERLPAGPYPGGAPEPGLEGAWDFEGDVVLGAPPESLTPILRLYDLDATGILWLGAHRDDLVFRHRNAGVARLALDYPEVRFPGALAPLQAGDTVRLGVRPLSGALCLRVDDRELCGLGVTPGRSWAVLWSLEHSSQSVRAILDTAWTGTLFLLVGLLGGSVRSTALLAAASAVLVVVAVEASPLVRGPPLEWIGLMMGIAAGYLLRPLVHDLVGRGVP